MTKTHSMVPQPEVVHHFSSALATQAQNLGVGANAQRGHKRKAAFASLPEPAQAFVNDSSNPYKVPKTIMGQLIKGS